MEESKKKPIMIGIIVACLVLAGLITYITNRPKSRGTADYAGQIQWVKCANEECGATYEMDKQEYLDQVEEEARSNVDASSALPITCKECGEKSIFRACKCPECGEVFFYGSVPGDYSDRCPKCGVSATQNSMKRGRTGR